VGEPQRHQRADANSLNALGIPIIFLVGNHDLYHRNSRSIYSTDPFQDLENFYLISEPTTLAPGWLAAPYLFREEYSEHVASINGHDYVLGHFEFKSFVLTGATTMLEHGPDATDFNGPRYIFTGHFHKRQAGHNVIYIGNTFPTNYGDAGDAERGCAIFDVTADDVRFTDWPAAPLFFKTTLSRVVAGDADFPPGSRVRCILDIAVSYSDVQALREELMTELQLREFSVEEDTAARTDQLTEGLQLDGEVDLTSLDSTVRKLIHEGVQPSPTIDPTMLVDIYSEL
jgi:DNA repair exonuclease SbcCD nuclease subunit